MEPIDILPEWVQIFLSLGLGFILLIIIAIIFSFFLPFFVYGIYNQIKRTNKYLKKMTELLEAQEGHTKGEEDPNPIFYQRKDQ